MKITHVNDWDGHTVIIESGMANSNFDSKSTIEIVGRGKTKADAIKSGLIAIGGLGSELKEMREKLSAL